MKRRERFIGADEAVEVSRWNTSCGSSNQRLGSGRPTPPAVMRRLAPRWETVTQSAHSPRSGQPRNRFPQGSQFTPIFARVQPLRSEGQCFQCPPSHRHLFVVSCTASVLPHRISASASPCSTCSAVAQAVVVNAAPSAERMDLSAQSTQSLDIDNQGSGFRRTPDLDTQWLDAGTGSSDICSLQKQDR